MSGLTGVGPRLNRRASLPAIPRRGGGCGFVCVVTSGCIALHGRMVPSAFKARVSEIATSTELSGMKTPTHSLRKGLERTLVGPTGSKIVIIMLT